MCVKQLFFLDQPHSLQHDPWVSQVKWELELKENILMQEVGESSSPGLENTTGDFSPSFRPSF